jgi:hypothetical protein
VARIKGIGFFLLFVVVLIFCMSFSYNFSKWKYAKDYNEMELGANFKITKIQNMVLSNTSKEIILGELDKLQTHIRFQNSVCFGGSKYDFRDTE